MTKNRETHGLLKTSRFLLLVLLGGCRSCPFVSEAFTPASLRGRSIVGRREGSIGGGVFVTGSTAKQDDMFFARVDATLPKTNVEAQPSSSASKASTVTVLPKIEKQEQNKGKHKQQHRVLGSQELLMLPRQYGPGADRFPQMNHVSVAVLSATPSVAALEKAIDAAAVAHPLLRCRVEGDGEPEERVDMFKMVRRGDPNPCTFVSPEPSSPDLAISDEVLTVVDVKVAGSDDEEEERRLEGSWRKAFVRDLDDGGWCDVERGPLWKVELHRVIDGNGGDNGSDRRCALLFSFNHAISDQSSAGRLLDQILHDVLQLEESGDRTTPAVQQDMPISLEDSILGPSQRWNDVQLSGFSPATIGYVAGKAAEGFKSPVILPDDADPQEQQQQQEESSKSSSSNPLGALTIISGRAAGGQDAGSPERRSAVQFRYLSEEDTLALLAECRRNGVSVTNALTAAMTLTATDFIDNDSNNAKNNKYSSAKDRNYKVLQSLDMRRFGARLDKGETVACMAGSMDLMHGPLPDRSGERLRLGAETDLDSFWELAKEGRRQTADFVDNDGPEQAVRVFDFAMSVADLNNLVHLTAQSKDTRGRAYSAGVTNAGVYERLSAFERQGEEEKYGSRRPEVRSRHGRYAVERLHFATPHTQSGSLYQVSCITVAGRLQMTFHPVYPMVGDETSSSFADAFTELLQVAAGTRNSKTAPDDDDSQGDGVSSNQQQERGFLSSLSENWPTRATAVLGAAAVASHGQAWWQFFRSVAEMKANVADPADFWAALDFWIFFAVGHPLLQPVLALSDVLHGSPGPKVADLVPISFLFGNAVVLATLARSKEIRNAVNIAALAVFLTYVGAGLEGTAGLGDFNLALDDGYRGQVVKGCPAYEDVRQPSMDNFDLQKYQGKWYEHKFHDWTQFKEVYDTTLSIKLTDGGKGWTDDFAVRGPAPDAAPLSWRASPVANGAHYFLFGRVDPADPPGVLRESGFGVEFPNYIVDVKKDPATGGYSESIQFQCLERGGVRVFEGINFLSRNPEMTDGQLADMHARAERAGMFPYGAAPEQMHTVARFPSDGADLDNPWQAMWHAIGFDRLLELLTESIEDGGR